MKIMPKVEAGKKARSRNNPAYAQGKHIPGKLTFV